MGQFSILPNLLSTTVTGSLGNDTLAGSDGNDVLLGQGGDDLFFEGRSLWTDRSRGPFVLGTTYSFGSGSDTISGGDGQDRLSYAGSTAPIVLNLAAGGNGTVSRQGDVDVFSGIETLILGSGADTITLGGARFLVESGTGNDLFRGLSRQTTLDGGAGSDSFDLTLAPSGATRVTVNLTTGRGPLDMVLRDIENLNGVATVEYILVGNAARNSLVGGSLNDSLSGGGGNDNLFGGSGDDLLYGGLGNDFLTGGIGDDLIFGGRGADTLRGAAGNDTMTAIGDVSVKLYGDLGNDVLTLRNGEAYGGEGNDTLITTGGGSVSGGAGNDLFQLARAFGVNASGGDGNDRFVLTGTSTGSGAQQILFGGAGNDSLHVESGRITIRETVVFGGEEGVVAYSDIETITFGTGPIQLFVEAGVDRDSSSYSLSGANNIVRLSADATSVVFTNGRNEAVLEGTNTSATMLGSDGITVTIRSSADYANVSTRDGADTIFMYDSTGTVDTGGGDDVLTLDAAESGYSAAYIRMGAGNDRLNLLGSLRSIDLGTGNDTLYIGEGGRCNGLGGGAGADTFVIDPNATGALVELYFDLGEDKISRAGVTSLADVDDIFQFASSVRLFFQSEDPLDGENEGTILFLTGLTIAQLTDDIFL